MHVGDALDRREGRHVEGKPRIRAVLTDIDGTLTDQHRRIHTPAIDLIRELVDTGVEVILASGNTACFMDAVSKMVGTSGAFIAENGGVYRRKYGDPHHIDGDPEIAKGALAALQVHFLDKGVDLDLYSPDYRFADRAFARTVSVDEVRNVLAGMPVQVIDTGFAIHLTSPGVDKGTALCRLAGLMQIVPDEFLAIGDGLNDIGMIRAAGIGAAVANAPMEAKKAADYVAVKKFGEGFIEVIGHYRDYFRD